MTPVEQILVAIKTTLESHDWEADGFERLTVRHARARKANSEEFPAITIRYVVDEPRQSDREESYYTADETAVEMTVILEIEDDLEAVQDNDDDAGDPTGIGFVSAIAFTALRLLRDRQGILLSLWADNVTDRGRAMDDETTSDHGRYEQTLVVLYRVLTDDPSVLLAQGVNA